MNPSFFVSKPVFLFQVCTFSILAAFMFQVRLVLVSKIECLDEPVMMDERYFLMKINI